MITREKRINLYQIFANAARIDDIETMTQAEIDKLSPKLRKIFQQQYDAFHDHYPDEIPDHIPTNESGIPSLTGLISAASLALDKAFKSTEKDFKEALVEHTQAISGKASEKVLNQFEPVIKALEEKAPSKPEPQISEPLNPEPIKAEIGMEFDYSNPVQHAKLEEHAAKMVSGIDEVTRQDIHDIIVKGHGENKTYSEIAADIRDKYSEFSESTGQGHIRDRAELIAVTEIASAAQGAGYDEALALADAGWEVEKFWNNTGDDKVSDGCLENTDAGWIPIDEPFPSGDDYPPRFPGCRCACSYRIVGRKKE